jgi:hypothetical protein
MFKRCIRGAVVIVATTALGLAVTAGQALAVVHDMLPRP